MDKNKVCRNWTHLIFLFRKFVYHILTKKSKSVRVRYIFGKTVYNSAPTTLNVLPLRIIIN